MEKSAFYMSYIYISCFGLLRDITCYFFPNYTSVLHLKNDIFLLVPVLQWTHSLKSVEYFAWPLHSSCCTLFLLQILD